MDKDYLGLIAVQRENCEELFKHSIECTQGLPAKTEDAIKQIHDEAVNVMYGTKDPDVRERVYLIFSKKVKRLQTLLKRQLEDNVTLINEFQAIAEEFEHICDAFNLNTEWDAEPEKEVIVVEQEEEDNLLPHVAPGKTCLIGSSKADAIAAGDDNNFTSPLRRSSIPQIARRLAALPETISASYFSRPRSYHKDERFIFNYSTHEKTYNRSPTPFPTKAQLKRATNSCSNSAGKGKGRSKRTGGSGVNSNQQYVKPSPRYEEDQDIYPNNTTRASLPLSPVYHGGNSKSIKSEAIIAKTNKDKENIVKASQRTNVAGAGRGKKRSGNKRAKAAEKRQ